MMNRWWLSVSKNRVVVILCLILGIQTGLLAWSAKVHSPTWDEVGHLAAGISHWETGRFDLYSVNPPLVRMIAAAPVVLFDPPEMDWSSYRSKASERSEVIVGRRMIELNGSAINRRYFLARLAILPIALLGTWFCYLIANSLFGSSAGLCAAALWAASPSVLGYGAVITPDLASAVVVLGVTLAIDRWFRERNATSVAILSCSIGVAMLVKSVWIFLPVAIVVVWLARSALVWLRRRYFGHEESEGMAPAKVDLSLVSAGQLAIAFGASLLIVNLFYGFEGSFKQLGSFEFVSEVLSGNEYCDSCTTVTPGNRFEKSLLGYFPVPLPSNYLLGIDVQKRDFERGFHDSAWSSFLLGEWKKGGWWYFYLVGLFYKEPLAIWIMIGLATMYRFVCAPLSESQRNLLLSLLAPTALVFLLISVNTGLNRYVRYALPLLPLLYIWASQLFTSGAIDTLNKLVKSNPSATRFGIRAFANSFASICLICFVDGSIFQGPNWLSFFNVLAGGKYRDVQILCDSNVDWGQDLPQLRAWLDKHPEATENLRLAYFGSYDPVYLGFDFKLPVPMVSDGPGDITRTVERLFSLEDQWCVISKNFLVGHPMPVPDGQGRLDFDTMLGMPYRYFNDLTPVACIGNSMLVYRIDQASRSQLITSAKNRFYGSTKRNPSGLVSGNAISNGKLQQPVPFADNEELRLVSDRSDINSSKFATKSIDLE